MNNTRKSLNNENSPLRSRKGSMISNNEKSEIQSPTKFHNDLNSSCESPGLKTINEFHFKPKDSFISN
jgi:hypothetical protein